MIPITINYDERHIIGVVYPKDGVLTFTLNNPVKVETIYSIFGSVGIHAKVNDKGLVKDGEIVIWSIPQDVKPEVLECIDLSKS